MGRFNTMQEFRAALNGLVRSTARRNPEIPWTRAYNNPKHLANWTVDPTFSYEEFYRANPGKVRGVGELALHVAHRRGQRSDGEAWTYETSQPGVTVTISGPVRGSRPTRSNPGKSPVPSFKKTPRAAAEGLYVFPARRSFPIGDLYHAKMAVEWSTTWPSLQQFHRDVLSTVEKAYPLYDWRAYSAKLAREHDMRHGKKAAANPEKRKSVGLQPKARLTRPRDEDPIVQCESCGKFTRESGLVGRGCLKCVGEDLPVYSRKNPADELPEASELVPGIPVDAIASKATELPVIVKGPNGPIAEPSGKILVIGTVLRGSDIQAQVAQVFEEFLQKWEAMKNPARRNPLSRPVYEPMPTNAGPYRPGMYPYGAYGRPASYTTEPSKKNPARKNRKK